MSGSKSFTISFSATAFARIAGMTTACSSAAVSTSMVSGAATSAANAIRFGSAGR